MLACRMTVSVMAPPSTLKKCSAPRLSPATSALLGSAASDCMIAPSLRLYDAATVSPPPWCAGSIVLICACIYATDDAFRTAQHSSIVPGIEGFRQHFVMCHVSHVHTNLRFL